MHKAVCLVLWGIKRWLRGALPCMFYSDNLFPVRLLVMLSGIALLALSNLKGTLANSVHVPCTLHAFPPPCRAAAHLPLLLTTLSNLLPLSQCPSHWFQTTWLCGNPQAPSCLPGCFIFPFFCTVPSDSSHFFLFSLWLFSWFALIISDEPA